MTGLCLPEKVKQIHGTTVQQQSDGICMHRQPAYSLTQEKTIGLHMGSWDRQHCVYEHEFVFIPQLSHLMPLFTRTSIHYAILHIHEHKQLCFTS
jgi:hypothetical protein